MVNYHKDGAPLWISLAINPLFDAQGHVERHISVTANITQTKLAFLENAVRLSAIRESTCMFDVDLRGQPTDASPALLRRLNASALAQVAQPLGQAMARQLTPERLARLQAGEPLHSNFAIEAPGCEPLWLVATSAIMGLLALSLLPPHPTTVITCSNPFFNFLIVVSTFSKASGVWA